MKLTPSTSPTGGGDFYLYPRSPCADIAAALPGAYHVARPDISLTPHLPTTLFTAAECCISSPEAGTGTLPQALLQLSLGVSLLDALHTISGANLAGRTQASTWPQDGELWRGSPHWLLRACTALSLGSNLRSVESLQAASEVPSQLPETRPAV